MKAWKLYDIGDIRFEEVKKPAPALGEVLVKVSASSICGSDIARIYQGGAHKYPLIPGHEFSGVVEKTGGGKDARWEGKRVGIFPLLPCKKCSMCEKKHYELCKNYNYLGSRCDGGFAEYVTVPEWNLIELPDKVSNVVAAMLEPMAVAVHAMRNMERAWEGKEKKKIVVIGLGTIGMFLVMFLKEAGYKNVYVVGNKKIQKDTVLSFGIEDTDYCDATSDDVRTWMKECAVGLGADVVFECVGRNETFVQAISAAGASGQVILVGNPASDMTLEKDVYWKILRNKLKLCGTWNSSFTKEKSDDWQYVLDKISKGKIRPERVISHKFHLDGLEDGLKLMRDKKEEYLKVMISKII